MTADADLLHGGALDRMRAAFPQAPEPWLDLSTGINPWPYPQTDCPPDAFEHLPRADAMAQCRAAMATAFCAPEEVILLAPGSEILIRLLPTILAPRRVALTHPSYGDHAQVWSQAGAEVIDHPDPLEAADTADLVVLCNPNNPDGRSWTRAALETARARLAARGGVLVLDEAYADLRPDLSMAPYGGLPGLIVLRSFGKMYGLAGVRLGALIAPDAIRTAMAQRLGVWSVSGPALTLGARAYADQAWLVRTQERLAVMRARLDTVLRDAGFTVAGGTDLFRFVMVGEAEALWRRLAHQGIYVRRFAWSSRHVRLGLPPTDVALQRLKTALRPGAE